MVVRKSDEEDLAVFKRGESRFRRIQISFAPYDASDGAGNQILRTRPRVAKSVRVESYRIRYNRTNSFAVVIENVLDRSIHFGCGIVNQAGILEEIESTKERQNGQEGGGYKPPIHSETIVFRKGRVKLCHARAANKLLRGSVAGLRAL